MSKQIDRTMLNRAQRQDHRQQKTLRERRAKRPMTRQERVDMLERVISELQGKVAGYTDPQAIALTERVIAQAEKELEQLKQKEGDVKDKGTV